MSKDNTASEISGCGFKQIVIAIQNQGKALCELQKIYELDLMDNLSKHNPYFDSEHDVESEKLKELRWLLIEINERISAAIQLIDLLIDLQ